MTKFFALIASAMVAVGASSAQANFDVKALQMETMLAARAGLNWHVGDKASYSLDLGFIKGKSDNSITQDTGTQFVMVQDMDLMIQKQKVEAWVNKSTGEIEKLLVNGQEQSIPKSDQEIVKMEEAKVTVPAGTYDCIYAQIKNKADGSITEAWINPQVVPMSGMLKAVAPSQIGKVTQEATSFSFATQP